MITCYCNRSEKEFWRMTPRKTIAIINQWKKIEAGRAQLRDFISKGGNPDEIFGNKEKKIADNYQAGEMMF
jgi:hypothetical protein